MVQHTQYTNDTSRKTGTGTRLAAALVAMLALAAGARAQTVLPVPIVSNIAGIAPGGTSTACTADLEPPFMTRSSTITAAGAYDDGCVPNQTVLATPYSTVVDSLGNIYIADYGHYALRVIYNGGSALSTAIQDANPSITGLVPQPGRIYTLAGGVRTATITKVSAASNPSGSTAYYCSSTGVAGSGTGPIALDSNGSACPGSEIYTKVRTPVLDNDGNIFFTSTSGGGQAPHVLCVQCAPGSALYKLLALEIPGTIPQTGFVYEIAGASTNGYNGDGGLAKNAALYSIRDIAVDAYENVYISDGASNLPTTTASNNNIRVIYAGNGPIPGLINVPNPVAGYMYTLAGGVGCAQGSTSGCPGTSPIGGIAGDGGAATSATFNSPYALFLDANANVYVADNSNARIRVIYQGTGNLINVATPPTKGYIYSVAGGGATSAASVTASGTLATQLAFGSVSVASMDPAGNLYLYDSTYRFLWRVDHATGIAVIIGGLGPSSSAGQGTGNPCIAGSTLKTVDTNGDGCPSTQVQMGASGQFSFDPQGNFYETESATTTSVVRKFSLNTQFAATPVGTPVTQPLAFLNVAATANYTAENFTLQGGATTEFSDGGSDTCTLNSTIAANTTCVFNVKFSPLQAGLRKGSVSFTGSAVSDVLSGIGQAPEASVDPGTQTTIGTGLKPNGVATDLIGNLYIADTTSNTVKKVAAAGGTPATLISGLNNPAQVAVDGKGNVYVADTGNNRIAMTTAAGGTITALGTGLSAPTGVAVDGLGNVYVADTGNNRVVKILAGGGQKTLSLTGTATPVPSRLALDAAGDLFVVDTANSDVVELAVNANQATVNLGTTAFLPSAVAVDAAGDLYVTDATNKQVLTYLVGSTNGNPLLTNLSAPVGIAVDVNGSVYVADTGAVGAIAVNRTLATVNFPFTNLGQSSPAPITFTDTGNLPLTFTGSQFATATGNTTQFSLASASANGCVLGTANAAGTACLLTANFTPTVAGIYSETISPVTNAANNGSLSGVLSGQGVQLITTTTTLTITSPTTTTINYGQTVVINSTTTLASNGGTPTGSITFTVDGIAQTPIAYGTGTATLTLTNLAVKTHSVSVSVTFNTIAGVPVYASSGNSLNFTVVKAVTTTALAITPTTNGSAVGTQFKATVSSTTATGETGTVNFYAGSTTGTPLNPSPITVTGGVATYNTTVVGFASNTFTAVYSGDTNFAGSSSTATTPAGDFNLTAASTIVTIPQGGNVTNNIVVTPYFGYSGTVTPSCTGGVPQYAICRYQPTSAVVSGGQQATFTIEVYTSTNLTSQNRSGGAGMTLALLSPLGLAALFFVKRRNLLGRYALLALVLIFSLAGVVGLSGCTNPVPVAPGGVTPAGTAPLTVTFTDSNTPQVSHSISFTLTIVPSS